MSGLPLRQPLAAGELPRHRHAHGYVAVVISGGYEEAGDRGRRRVQAGEVVAHAAYEAHLNRVPVRGATVLNLPLPSAPLPAFGLVDDPDALVRAAERDVAEAVELLATACRPAAEPAAEDWPDLLAEALTAAPVRIGDWARAHGLSAEHAARGFRRVFGATPQAFGREARARAALFQAAAGRRSLADIAVSLGFSDQAHMTRAVTALSGRPPGAWRRSNPFKTPA